MCPFPTHHDLVLHRADQQITLQLLLHFGQALQIVPLGYGGSPDGNREVGCFPVDMQFPEFLVALVASTLAHVTSPRVPRAQDEETSLWSINIYIWFHLSRHRDVFTALHVSNLHSSKHLTDSKFQVTSIHPFGLEMSRVSPQPPTDVPEVVCVQRARPASSPRRSAISPVTRPRWIGGETCNPSSSLGVVSSICFYNCHDSTYFYRKATRTLWEMRSVFIPIKTCSQTFPISGYTGTPSSHIKTFIRKPSGF